MIVNGIILHPIGRESLGGRAFAGVITMSEQEKSEKTQVQILRDAFEGMKGRQPKLDQELKEWLATDEGQRGDVVFGDVCFCVGRQGAVVITVPFSATQIAEYLRRYATKAWATSRRRTPFSIACRDAISLSLPQTKVLDRGRQGLGLVALAVARNLGGILLKAVVVQDRAVGS